MRRTTAAAIVLGLPLTMAACGEREERDDDDQQFQIERDDEGDFEEDD
jgi:hypothetical protein